MHACTHDMAASLLKDACVYHPGCQQEALNADTPQQYSDIQETATRCVQSTS